MICLITVAVTCHTAPLTPDSLHGAGPVELSTWAHTHSETVQGFVLDMVLLSHVCEAAKLSLHTDSEESHTSKDLVPPTVMACVLTSTTAFRVCRDYRSAALNCPDGKLQAITLPPHLLTGGSMHCCSPVTLTSILKILPQVARLLLCKQRQPGPPDA